MQHSDALDFAKPAGERHETHVLLIPISLCLPSQSCISYIWKRSQRSSFVTSTVTLPIQRERQLLRGTKERKRRRNTKGIKTTSAFTCECPPPTCGVNIHICRVQVKIHRWISVASVWVSDANVVPVLAAHRWRPQSWKVIKKTEQKTFYIIIFIINIRSLTCRQCVRF